ncbi:hypothetical protein HPB51_014630 [Rhipicephalus microplus]|uniref:PAS domain-containing protein n=1 Tax=Rhipicephalus microplus TaxID=6941 RepID=A0A9J6F554_RHIMP|nr:hypothetical protein HPB51_014630 [Rhipicephalus microplus]
MVGDATTQVMFVFEKEDDAQYQTLRAAAERMHYECTLALNTEEALNFYLVAHPHLVFVDTRDGNSTESVTLCRMLRSFKGCEFSCLVAVVKKALAEQDDAAIIPLLRSGYNRWFSESCSLGVCLNEMIQIEHNDLVNLWKLMASETLFSALHHTRDSVIVTGPKHEIQYMNSAAEKFVGFSVEEMLGRDARDLYELSLLRPDVAGGIGTLLSEGKEWQGTLLQKRKGGESVPVLSKITPIDINTVGKSDYIVYVKENPFFMDKPFSADMVVGSGDVIDVAHRERVLYAQKVGLSKSSSATRDSLNQSEHVFCFCCDGCCCSCMTASGLNQEAENPYGVHAGYSLPVFGV